MSDNGHIDGLVLRSLDDVRSHSGDDVVDPRLRSLRRPSQEQLDEGLVRQLSDIVHHREHQHHHGQPHQKLVDEEKGMSEKEKETSTDSEEEVIYVRPPSILNRLVPSVN